MSNTDDIKHAREGSAATLDALATAAGPMGCLAVNEDGAIAIHGPAPACNCDQSLVLKGALRVLVATLGNDPVRGLSRAAALAFMNAAAELRRWDGADYHSEAVERVVAHFEVAS